MTYRHFLEILRLKALPKIAVTLDEGRHRETIPLDWLETLSILMSKIVADDQKPSQLINFKVCLFVAIDRATRWVNCSPIRQPHRQLHRKPD